MDNDQEKLSSGIDDDYDGEKLKKISKERRKGDIRRMRKAGKQGEKNQKE